MLLATAAAAYFLIHQVTQVTDLPAVFARVDWRWAFLALAGSAVTYVGAGLNLIGGFAKRLPLGLTAAVQLGGSFINRISPGRSAAWRSTSATCRSRGSTRRPRSARPGPAVAVLPRLAAAEPRLHRRPVRVGPRLRLPGHLRRRRGGLPRRRHGAAAASTPGGVGAVEAALIAGLKATGVPTEQAVPAVLVYRIATFWLPVPPGWLAFTLLTRSDVI
jgi:hypothetical protein